MTVGYDTKSLDRIMAIVEDRANFDRAALRRRFKDVPLGQARPDDKEFSDWFEMKAQETPAAEITFLDGTKIFESPWIVALAFVDGGDEILRRYTKLRGA